VRASLHVSDRPSLEQQHPAAVAGEVVGRRKAHQPASYDDHLGGVGHRVESSKSMETEAIILLPLIAVGILGSVFRLWWIWWVATCHGCGLLHRTCECPAGDHMMRPRK
jgi:hypothetical protein